jgi:hypothetical protein
MRLYVKLVLMVALFAGLAGTTGRRMTGALAYEARVAFVCAFGTEADYAALVDDTQRALAEESGNVHLYQAGQRFRQLLAERMAEAARRAARRNVPLSDDERARIYSQSVRDAFAEGRASGTRKIPPCLSRPRPARNLIIRAQFAPFYRERPCRSDHATVCRCGMLNPRRTVSRRSPGLASRRLKTAAC